MRNAESLLLIAFLALVGLGLWNGKNWLRWDARNWLRSPHIAAAEAPKTATPARPLTSAAAAVKSRRKSGERGDGATIFMPSEPVSVMDVPAPLPRFPEPRDLKSGMSTEQIVSTFGEPTARVTRPERGEVSEWLYYFNRERTRATVANLHGGVLVSAETMRF